MHENHNHHEIVVWRTRLLPGFEDDYTRIHRRIPDGVAKALEAAGVVDWRIWRDGLTLFHVIHTRDGRDVMGERMAALGPIDPEWDALISSMLDSAEASSSLLPLVWGMDRSGQL